MIESYLKGFEAFSRNGGASAPQWARSLRLSAIGATDVKCQSSFFVFG